MNIFAEPAYLTALADVYFPGRAYAIEPYQTQQRLYRLLRVGRRVITAWPFMDFVMPLRELEPRRPRALPYLPRTVLATTEVHGSRPPPAPGATQPSPYIEWGRFSTWADFERMVGERIGNLFPDSRRKRRKLERDLGLVRFVLDDDAPEAFERCVAWKSSQYRETGLTDMFATPAHVEMFRELKRRGLVVVSTLTAGTQLLAVHLGGLAANRLYWWVPAYDPAFARYSPGRLMLESLLEASFAAKHAEFDFLIGDEPYKWHYATHNRDIGPLGRTPLAVVLKTEARARARKALEGHPALLERARGLKRRLGL